MMEDLADVTTKTFIEVSEVWVPEDGRLVLAAGNYGSLSDFASVSERTSFAEGEGLPGKAWAEQRPVVLKSFDGSYFRRIEAAAEAGLTSAVAIPVFDGKTLKAVLVVLCSDSQERIGAIEVWTADDKMLSLNDGYYGAAKHFAWVSEHTSFPRGQGLPGAVWAAQTPILMRDLGAGYAFIRSESAGKAGLTTGLGIPIPSPSPEACVLTLLSARGTPIARRFEIWDARKTKVGTANDAVLIDGICAHEGALWNEDSPPRISAWQGMIGKVLGTGMPQVESGSPITTHGYDSMVALPIYQSGELSHVIAWYC